MNRYMVWSYAAVTMMFAAMLAMLLSCWLQYSQLKPRKAVVRTIELNGRFSVQLTPGTAVNTDRIIIRIQDDVYNQAGK